MKVLITGGTGFIGKALIKKLNEKGHELVVLTRNPDAAGFHIPVHCDIQAWNQESGILSSDKINGVDAIINLSGENIADGRWTDSRKQKIIKSRVQSVQCLTNAIKAMTQKPRVFISASAIGFYGERGDESLEETNTKGHGFLSDVCQQWEKEIFKVSELGVKTVALRIGMVLGHDGGALQKMLPPFKLGLGGKLGNGNQWMSWIHIQDLISMIIHAIEKPSLEGTYNAVSPNPIQNHEFTKTLASILNRPAITPVPKFILKFALGELSELLLGSQKVSAKKSLETGFSYEYPCLKDALKEVCSHNYHEVKVEQWVPATRENTFAFFKEAKNLEVITPDFLHFKVLKQSTPRVQEGTKINYSLSLHGMPFRWQSQITDWKPDQMFSDIQLKGPYSYWSHKHEFEEKDGGTLIKDHVLYKVPFGILGDFIAHGFIRRDIEKIFTYRQKKIDELFNHQDKNIIN